MTRKWKSKNIGQPNSLHIDLHIPATPYFWWLYIVLSTQAAFFSPTSAIYVGLNDAGSWIQVFPSTSSFLLLVNFPTIVCHGVSLRRLREYCTSKIHRKLYRFTDLFRSALHWQLHFCKLHLCTVKTTFRRHSVNNADRDWRSKVCDRAIENSRRMMSKQIYFLHIFCEVLHLKHSSVWC